MINLKSCAVWLPETYEDSTYISEQSGIPKDVLEKKMGIIKKCRAPLDCHPSQMAINAAKSAMKDLDRL
jgi:3-oxoacyl-[acyl-carrier-protein] synthase-3